MKENVRTRQNKIGQNIRKKDNCSSLDDSYLTLREPYEDQGGPYWAKGGHWNLLGGPYRTNWCHRDFIWSPKGFYGHQ